MKKWLIERFLPMWAKQTVLADNQRLKERNLQLEQKVATLDSYIKGMRTALRAARYPWDERA